MAFSQFHLNPKLNEALKDLGFTTPTPIQKMAIPPLMEGKDILAAAATGSGKTAAFLLPIMNDLLGKPRGKTRVLVLAPTRELAAQIVEHFDMLGKHTNLKAAAVYGGVGMNPQVAAFNKKVDLIAACPGRLLDHFQYPYSKLDDLEYLVLDEADRMLDMGFLPDVKKVLKHLPKERRTLLFSATMPEPIVKLSKEILKDPVALNIERKSEPAAGIRHSVFPVPEELKKHLLLKLLKRPEAKSVLAFTRTKHRANRLADFLTKNGVPCERIHGNRSQMQRTDALKGFKEGKFQVLVATDIAARGIDVEALGLVVNFDVPAVPEDYIHRSGRTARAELTGDAYTLVSPQEEGNMRAIERELGKTFPRQKVGGFDYAHKADDKLEVPIGERIAQIRARKAEDRARHKAKLEAKAARTQQQPQHEGRKSENARQKGPAKHAGDKTRQWMPEGRHFDFESKSPNPDHHIPRNDHIPSRDHAPKPGAHAAAPHRDGGRKGHKPVHHQQGHSPHRPPQESKPVHEGHNAPNPAHLHAALKTSDGKHEDRRPDQGGHQEKKYQWGNDPFAGKPPREGSPYERQLREGSFSRLFSEEARPKTSFEESVEKAAPNPKPFRKFHKPKKEEQAQ